jgi:hypothetical protein
MLLDSMALYSSIAWRQWGSTSVLRTKVGTGDSVEEAVAASSPHTGPPVYHLVAVTRERIWARENMRGREVLLLEWMSCIAYGGVYL